MRRIILFSCLLIGLLAPIQAGAEQNSLKPKKISLQEAYDLALKTSETLQLKEQDIRIAEADYREALAALYPNINFGGSQRIKNSKGLSSNTSAGTDNTTGIGNNGTSNSRSKNQFETSFRLSQPLFRGFRDQLLSSAAESEILARKFDSSRAREILFLDVADVFNQIILYQSDLKILSKVENTLSQRVDELHKFIDLGKSRESEILAARSDIADVRSVAENTRGLLGASKELLAFLTGIPARELELDEGGISMNVEPIDSYVSQSRDRADLKAAVQRQMSAEQQVTAAEREHWPSITLEGNYYPYDEPDLNRDWDVLFRLGVPVFDGGAIDARISRQKALLRSSQISINETQRRAERDVRTAYHNFQSSIAEQKSLQALFDASEKNYQSQRKDYEFGVVTNIEVLQAIRQVQDARRRLLDAEISARVNKVRLEVAAGGLR